MLLWLLMCATGLASEPASAPRVVDAAPPPEAIPWRPVPDATPVVQDPGARPRRRLTLRPRGTDRWQLQESREQAVTMNGSSREQPGRVIIADVLVDGGHVVVQPTDLDLLTGNPAHAVAARDAIRGVAEQAPPTAPLDPGQRARIQADPTPLDPLAAQLLDDLVWSLQATAVPLPDTPVGPGATWNWRVPVGGEEASVTQQWTATLVAARGRSAVVDVQLDATADVMADASGVEGRLSASGRVWLDRRRPLAKAAEVTLTAVLVHRPAPDPAEPDAAPPEPIEATLDATIRIATREAPAPGASDG